ncbi:unnamed protein product, partial [Phaedon cochleariae]
NIENVKIENAGEKKINNNKIEFGKTSEKQRKPNHFPIHLQFIMAEAVGHPVKSDYKDKVQEMECAVCLQRCIHPAQLPCGHIFCFLCVKGFANQNKKCAMCRQEIPKDFIEQPHLLEAPAPLENTEGFDGGFQWFYEGRNGWWQYDERTSKDLEASYKKDEITCELLIAGFLYIIDLENMLQVRRNDPSRRRRIKRDYYTIPKKGIAGLPIKEQTDETKGRDEEDQQQEIPREILVNPPETAHSDGSDDALSGLEETLHRLDMLSLNHNHNNLS